MTYDFTKKLLDENYSFYNRKSFIPSDPISVPHRFRKKEDIEIAGFFAAVFSWGNRKTIINKSNELLKLMDDAPHEFILHHSEKELKHFRQFKHRTFNLTDALYFIHFFKHHYSHYPSLEIAFSKFISAEDENVEPALRGFHDYFCSLEAFPSRTKKHIPTPARNSTCKRINMFLRWMVRSDHRGVDFGIWKKIKPSQLICPCDVHVLRVARQLKLISSKQNNWKTAVELTSALKKFDAKDPVKYDFALFGIGVNERIKIKP